MKNILIPTDFSDNSWNALLFVLKLYEHEECVIYLLNSTNTIGTITENLSNKLRRTLRENSQRELEIMIRKVITLNRNENHRFESISSSGYLIDAINNSIKKFKIEMVIMGTKGATGSKEIFFGSNTVRVLENMRLCPILIIPEEHEFSPPKQIAFATAFNRLYTDSELKPLLNIANVFNSSIRVVHIQINKKLNSTQQHHKSKLEDFLQGLEHSFHWLPNYAKKNKEINTFIESSNIELLAMVNYRHSFIEKLVKEPVIKKIGFHCIVPFLVMPE